MKGKSLVGFLVLLTLAAAGRAQTQQTQPPAQTREIEWLVNQGTNYLLARSYASVQLDIKDTCTVAMLHRPKDCAWCDQFNRCLQQTPGLSAPFIAKVDNEVTLARPTLDASTRSSAYHSAYFGPLSFRLSNRVITTYENRGEYQPSNRGIAEVSGEIFFRIPPGLPLNYELSGELQRAGGDSHLQLIGVVNTGANSDGFSFNTNHLPKGVLAPLKKAGSLTPGVYRLFWFLTADQISHGGSSEASLDLRIVFGPCDAKDSRLTHEGATLPSRSVDEAAQRALAEAWARTVAGQSQILPIKLRDREWGGLIYETGPGTGEYRYTRPFQGSEGEMEVVDLTTSFDRVAALGLCEGQNYQLAGVYHTHPAKMQLFPDAPGLVFTDLAEWIDVDGSHLSVGDINFAIFKGQETGRPFSIYARGHNGKTCGIHKYTTGHGHVHVDTPANATPKQREAIQTNDRRRDSAVWIPLSPAQSPARSCTPNGGP